MVPCTVPAIVATIAAPMAQRETVSVIRSHVVTTRSAASGMSTLDTIACHFPELKLVGIHIGWPWVEEMISVAYKHPNVYIGSDAYAPAYWDQKFIHFIDSWGSKKVIFGTDFPVIDPERARSDIEKLDIREDSKRRFLRDNVIDLYKLDLPKAGSAA